MPLEDTIVDGDAAPPVVTPPAAPATPPATPVADPPKASPVAGDITAVPEGDKTTPGKWGETWRADMAGDNKEYLALLERMTDPSQVAKSLFEAQKKIREGKVGPQKPGKDATPEQHAEYRKAIGLPEKAEALVESMKLPDGRTLGEPDMAIAKAFADSAYGADMTQSQFNHAVGWYLKQVETEEANRTHTDQAAAIQGRDALRDEWGAEYKANINRVEALFGENKDLFNRIVGARDAEGRKIGNNPDFFKTMAAIHFEMSPMHTTVLSDNGTPTSVEQRLKELQGLATSNPDEYWSAKVQAEELKLIDLQLKQQGRASR